MTSPITFTHVTPYLFYPDGDAAAEWLTRVLGFGPVRKVPDDNGAWAEGSIGVGDQDIHLNGGMRGELPGSGALLIIGIDDVDALYRRIADAGEDIDPPKDEPYGPRSCHVTDPWGYQWYFWQGEARFD